MSPVLAPKCLLCREPSLTGRFCVQCRTKAKSGAFAAGKFAARVAAGTFGAFLEREHPVAYDSLKEAHVAMRRAQFEAQHPEAEILDAKVVDFGARRARAGGRRA